MDQAHIVQLADAIVDELNRQEFSLAFTAERAYLPVFELQDMNELKVTVVPKQDDGKLDTRSSSAHEYAVDIGVQMKPPTIDNENLDPLMGLTQEIADFFLFGQRPGGTTLIAPQVRILFLQEHLHKFHQFTAVVTLTFKGWRQAA
jgi:hypothetical protein